MKKIVVFILIAVLNSLIVNAALNNEEISILKDKINEKRHLIPAGFRSIFGDVTASVIISGLEYKAISVNGKLELFELGNVEDPTMEILTSEEVLRDFINEKISLGDALKNGKVIYRPISKKSKTINTVAKIGRFVNRILGIR